MSFLSSERSTLLLPLDTTAQRRIGNYKIYDDDEQGLEDAYQLYAQLLGNIIEVTNVSTVNSGYYV